MSTPVPFLQLAEVHKSFGAVHALRGIDIGVQRGTVHALVGENGAGKSTLGKVVAGIHRPDSGTVRLAGEEVSFQSPRDALRHGITMVAQELALVETRSVLENIYLGSEPHLGPLVRTARLRRSFDALTERTGIDLPARASVHELTIADQQKVEILRAIARGAETIVMDEPTARLTSHEAKGLLRILRQLAEDGTTIIYVSHFLDEVLEIADLVTVMRDGEIVGTAPAQDHTPDTLVREMIGRPLDAAFPVKQPVPLTEPVLEVEGLGRGTAFSGVDLSVRRGEIVMITGLVGSGRSEVLQAIVGDRAADTGTVRLLGEPTRFRHPRAAIDAGIAYVPESRKTQGLLLETSITGNVSLPRLKSLTRGLSVNRARERALVTHAIDRIGVKSSDPSQPVSTLSGGNQQKVLFAKALAGDPLLLLADEPTRGVDVQAKRQIYDLLVELAGHGLGLLVVSSEMEEVIGLAHRVLVMRAGRIAGELSGTDITEANIAALAFDRAATATVGGAS